MSGAEATSEEIRRLIEDGLSREAVAEEVGVPESVVAAWLERNDVDLDEQEPAVSDGEAGDSNAESDFPGTHDGEVYKCECGDVVPVDEMTKHDERCPPEIDWRRA